MRMEALGQWDGALQVYEALAERDPTNTVSVAHLYIYKWHDAMVLGKRKAHRRRLQSARAHRGGN